MADFIKTVLGKGRGKVGDVVFRVSHGKTILSSVPATRTPSTDPVVIKRKKRFGLTVKLAHAVNYLYQLKFFWKLVDIGSAKGFRSAFNKIVKLNYPYVTFDNLGDDIMLVPDSGFEVTATSIELTNTEVNVVLNAIGTDKGIDLATETKCQLALVFFLKSPSDPNKPEFHFIHVVSVQTPISLSNPLTFTFTLTNIEKQKFDEYSVRKAFFALVTLDADDKPVRYSNTFKST
ncbi:MAG: hypothetical protein ACOYN6_08715 [Ignavibacteria bacterium]|nr:hypothetical protein [Ignavibacteriota bacterium]